jgi:hypothetical protein
MRKRCSKTVDPALATTIAFEIMFSRPSLAHSSLTVSH